MKNAKTLSVAAVCLIALVGLVSPSRVWADSVGDKLKDWIESGSESLKKGVDELGHDFNAIQDYLNNYQWKGIVEDKATSGPVTLKHLELNDHSRAVVAKPGEKIEAEVKCYLDSEQSSPFGVYRVIVGIQGEGAQVLIGNALGLKSGKTREKFTLTAPDRPGIYQIRFRAADSFLKETAFNSWKDEQGNEPDAKSTVGVIIVVE